MALHVDTHKSGWFSVKEACQILDISRQTLYNWTKTNKIQSKVEKKHRFVWLDLNGEYQSEANVSDTDTDLHTDLHEKGTNLHSDEQFYSYRLQTLEKDLNYFRSKCDRLEEQLSEQSKRHDTIVMKLSGTIENQASQLEHEKSATFWKRLFSWRQRSTDSFISEDCLWFDLDNDEGDRKKFDLWEDESLFWTIEKFTEYFKDYEFLIRTSRRHRIDKVKSFTDAQFESYRVQTLEKDLDYFRRKCDKLEDQLADQSKRHDTIVLGMTNTISDQKLELTEGQHTFNTRIAEFEQELASTKSDLEAVRNRGFWARLFNR